MNLSNLWTSYALDGAGALVVILTLIQIAL